MITGHEGPFKAVANKVDKIEMICASKQLSKWIISQTPRKQCANLASSAQAIHGHAEVHRLKKNSS